MMMCSNISSDVPFAKKAGEDGEGEAKSAMVCKKQWDAETSKFRGVSWNARDKKWMARIRVDGKLRGLGRFAVEEDAAKAFDRVGWEVHGR